ncbi:MAG: hypothetical protein AB1472_06210 [Candidatus Omnitrophota bacterium]
MSPEAFINFFIPLFFIIAIIVAIFNKSKEKEALKILGTSLNGHVVKYSLIPRFEGVYQAINYSIFLSPGESKSEKNSLSISFFKKPTFVLRITKENILTEIVQKIKSTCEIKIGDAEFDKNYFIKTDQKERATSYLNNSSIKQIINELFNQGFDEISFDKEKIFIQKPNYDLMKDITPANISKILEYLSILSQGT